MNKKNKFMKMQKKIMIINELAVVGDILIVVR